MDPSGQLDLQQLFAAAAQMQNQLMSAQQELADTTVEGTAGGGLVTAVVNGQGEIVDLRIQAAAIDPANAEESAQTIADLVLAACRDAYEAAEQLQEDMMSPVVAGMAPGTGPDDPAAAAAGAPGGLGIPGMPAFPGLPGLFAMPADVEDDYDEDDYDDEDYDEGDGTFPPPALPGPGGGGQASLPPAPPAAPSAPAPPGPSSPPAAGPGQPDGA